MEEQISGCCEPQCVWIVWRWKCLSQAQRLLHFMRGGEAHLPPLPRNTVLADRLAQFVHFFSLNYSLRPFGASAVVAGHDAFQGTHELYVVEPSGVSYVRVYELEMCVGVCVLTLRRDDYTTKHNRNTLARRWGRGGRGLRPRSRSSS